MMKHISTLLLATFIQFSVLAQQDVKLPGLVVEQNSKFNTGEVVYLSNAQVKSYGAIPRLSDANGAFTLVFADKPVGNVTRVYATKNGYEVVNDEVLKRAAVLGRNSPLKVVMCKQGTLYENQIVYYNIIRDIDLENHNKKMAILKKEGEERAQLMAKLEQEFNQKITSVEQANLLLTNQLKAAQERAKELADRFLVVNLDDQSEEYHEAFRKFLAKDIDGALEILETIEYEKNLETIEEEIAKVEALMTAYQKDLEKLKENKKQYVELCLLQARLYILKYEFSKAEEKFELALKYDADNPKILFEYANYLREQNQHNKAQPLYHKTLKKYRKLAEGNPQTYLPDLGMTLTNLGILQSDKNELEQAGKSYQEALEIYRKLAEGNPQTYLPDLGMTLTNLGILQSDKNELEQAGKSYQEALEIYRKLAEVNPQTYLPDVAMTLNNLGILQGDKNELEQAGKSYQEALEIYRKLTEINPQTYLPYVATTLNNLGILQHTKNELEQAGKSYQEALEIYRKLAEVNPQTYLPDVAMTLNNLGILQGDKNELEQAGKSYQEALEIYRKLAEVNPPTYLPYVAVTLNNLANLQGNKNELEQAEKSFREALKIRRKLAEVNPQTYLPDLATTQINLGIFYLESIINKEKSIKITDEAITNLLPFQDIPYIQNYLKTAYQVLQGWDIDVKAYLKEKKRSIKD